MNKENAKEIINTEIIETLKSHQQMSACFDYDDDGNAKPNNNYAYYDELLQALHIAVESLDNEWVDVRDRLPSEDGDYLVQLQIDARGKEIYFLQVSFYTYDNGTTEWLYNGFYNAFKNVDLFVIAWKPLPQPYERKE